MNHIFRLFTFAACGFLFVGHAMGQPTPPLGKKWVALPALSDEFDAWDPLKWTKPLWNYGEPVQMLANNSGVADGKLWIKATLDNTSARWFETSRVMSIAQTSYPVYTECSMKTAHISAYNTFWLNNGDSANRDEFDICENNSNPSITSQTYRPYTMYSQYFIVVNSDVEREHGDYDNRNLSEGNALMSIKWNEAYQTLGAWWKDENNIQFYLNGEPAGSVVSTRDFTRDLNIIWDLWTVDATWIGGLAIQSDLLDDSINTMYVDWIHTYELVDDLTYAPPIIASSETDAGNLVMHVADGPASGAVNLHSSSSLSSPAESWAISQAGLPLDASGAATVTAPMAFEQEFFYVIETEPLPSMLSITGFTSPDYGNGSLNNQQAWKAEAGWIVADSAGAGNASTFDNSSAATLDIPITLAIGHTYSLSVALQFGGGPYSTPTTYVYAFLGGLKDSNTGASVTTGSTAADANIQIIQNTDDYRLLNNFLTISGASDITGTELNAGDILQYDYELTLGVDAASTSYRVRLQNLTDATDTGWGTVSGVDATIYAALTGSGAYGFFQSISPGSGSSGLSGVQVNAVTSSIIH